MPAPDPVPDPVTVIHDAPARANHEQFAWVVTFRLPEPPEADGAKLVGLTV